MTSLRPDQVSSTAQTLMSTRFFSEGEGADGVFGHVGGDAGGLFGPGDPEGSVGVDLLGGPFEKGIEIGAGLREKVDDVDGRTQPGRDGGALAKRRQKSFVIGASAADQDSGPGFDAQLFGEGSTGITCHGWRAFVKED